MKTVILDTETTGFNDPEAVEVAWWHVAISDTPRLSMLEWFNARYRPSKPIELGAMATHHIMDEDLVGCDPSSEFRLPDGTEFIIGHNVDYDWKAIGRPDVKRICTLAMARRLWPELDSHSQSALLYHLRRRDARMLVKEAHSALTDISNCQVILAEILAKKPEILDVESLYQFSEDCRIPTHMAFGKYKGWLIADVPSDYISWCLRQADTDPYLVKAFMRPR